MIGESGGGIGRGLERAVLPRGVLAYSVALVAVGNLMTLRSYILLRAYGARSIPGA